MIPLHCCKHGMMAQIRPIRHAYEPRIRWAVIAVQTTKPSLTEHKK